jgi:hypothetical protein
MTTNAEALKRVGMVIDETTRVMNVKEPWAHALIYGDKDVENRPNHLKIPLPAWVLILSSKSIPTKKDMEKFHSFGASSPDKFAAQEIIGAVRFDDSVTNHPSKWYSGPYAWVVGARIAFPDPIRNVKGSQSQLRYLSKMREKDRIYAQLHAEEEFDDSIDPNRIKNTRRKRKIHQIDRGQDLKKPFQPYEPSSKPLTDRKVSPRELLHYQRMQSELDNILSGGRRRKTTKRKT